MRKSKRNKSRGAMFVEAAIVAPVVAVVLSAGLNLGLYFDVVETAADTSADAVRYIASLATTTSSTESDVRQLVEQKMLSSMLAACFSCENIDVETTFSDYTNGGASGRMVQVTVEADYKIVAFPIGPSTLHVKQSMTMLHSSL